MTLLFQVWGNLDWGQLAGCFVSKSCTCFFGDLFEVMNAGRKPKDVNWTPYYYGCIMGLLPWAIMIFELVSSPNVADIPTFVWIFVAEYFLCFFSFPIVMWR